MSRWKQVSSLVHNKTLVSSFGQRASYTFTPNKEEVIESRFRLRYSTTCDSYYRDWFDAIDPSSKGVIPGWDKAMFSVDNVRRHLNEDIGQVYLERVPGSSTGCIKWHIDFGCCGLLVDEVTVRLLCVEEYGGEITVTMTGIPGQKRVRYAVGSDYVTYTELQNSPELTLAVHFVGEADQVTQLFPQNILRGMGYPLDIQVILKQPLSSLGKPRILVGLLYSSSQEIEVDARHYKQNTSNQSSQGFLHIHLFRGRDLPQGKQGSTETFSKCYLLPDAKKTTKCRTKARKGKDPFWNEQYLVVGINYHEIKRRALEICIADSRTSVGKKAKFIGGLRLSLGYEAVVSAQTEQVNQVLRFLKIKGEAAGEKKDLQRKVSFSKKETVIGSVNSSSLKWKKAAWTRVATEGSVDMNRNEENGEKVETTKEQESAADREDVKIVNNNENDAKKESQRVSYSSSAEEIPTVWYSAPDLAENQEKVLVTSVTRPERNSTDTSCFHTGIYNATHDGESEERRRLDLANQRLLQSLMSSIKELEFVPRPGNEEQSPGQRVNDSKQDEIKRDIEENAIVLNVIRKENNITKADSEDLNCTKSSEHFRHENDHGSNKEDKEEVCTPTEACNEEISTTEAKKTGKVEIDAEALESENISLEKETVKAFTVSKEIKRSSSFNLKDFGKKLGLRQRIKSGEDNGLNANFETKADKVMLDAQGLEITQWKLMVERPKEWHYCWHILRSEMTILH